MIQREGEGPVHVGALVAKELRRLQKLCQWRQEAERKGEDPEKMVDFNFKNPEGSDHG